MRSPQLMKAVLILAIVVSVSPVFAQDDEAAAKPGAASKAAEKTEKAPPTESTTPGSVTVGGQTIAYTAVAGTITVGATDVEDAQLGVDGKPEAGSELALSAPKKPRTRSQSRRFSMWHISRRTRRRKIGR